MKTKRVAFATCQEVPDLYDDDRSARSALKAEGYEIVPAIWDSGSVNWSKFDAIVIRSTWYYWLKYEAFLKWISEIEKIKVPVFNSPSVLRENSRKTYLKRIESNGIPVLPTHWIESSPKESLTDILKQNEWDEAVLKPSVSGGAYRTHRITIDTAKNFDKELQEILNDSEAMIQPLASTIFSEGEISFLFYGGKYSHAAIKKGSEGEFRIQRVYGGTIEGYDANPFEIEQAIKALEAYCAPKDLLYARIDCVRDPKDPKRLLLMELEATEPNLFFEHDQFHPGAAERFAKALTAKLS